MIYKKKIDELDDGKIVDVSSSFLELEQQIADLTKIVQTLLEKVEQLCQN